MFFRYLPEYYVGRSRIESSGKTVPNRLSTRGTEACYVRMSR